MDEPVSTRRFSRLDPETQAQYDAALASGDPTRSELWRRVLNGEALFQSPLPGVQIVSQTPTGTQVAPAGGAVGGAVIGYTIAKFTRVAPPLLAAAVGGVGGYFIAGALPIGVSNG